MSNRCHPVQHSIVVYSMAQQSIVLHKGYPCYGFHKCYEYCRELHSSLQHAQVLLMYVGALEVKIGMMKTSGCAQNMWYADKKDVCQDNPVLEPEASFLSTIITIFTERREQITTTSPDRAHGREVVNIYSLRWSASSDYLLPYRERSDKHQ